MAFMSGDGVNFFRNVAGYYTQFRHAGIRNRDINKSSMNES